MHINGCGNNRRQVKKFLSIGSISILLMLFPSVAYAHDLSGYVFFPIGVMFLQIFYGITMLLLKKKEMAGHYFVVSGLYIGLLGLLWLGVLFGFREVADYLEGVDYFESVEFLLAFQDIFMIGYWIVFPLVAAYLLAWALYRKFREPVFHHSATGRRKNKQLGPF